MGSRRRRTGGSGARPLLGRPWHTLTACVDPRPRRRSDMRERGAGSRPTATWASEHSSRLVSSLASNSSAGPSYSHTSTRTATTPPSTGEGPSTSAGAIAPLPSATYGAPASRICRLKALGSPHLPRRPLAELVVRPARKREGVRTRDPVVTETRSSRRAAGAPRRKGSPDAGRACLDRRRGLVGLTPPNSVRTTFAIVPGAVDRCRAAGSARA
jgi:hypothetical protein